MARRKAVEKEKVLRRKLVPPTMLVKLMEAIGPTRAATQLGVSTTLVHKAKKEGEVNRVVEIAAANILEHLGDGGRASQTPAAPRSPMATATGGEAVFMAAVPAGKADVFQRMAAALGVTIIPT